MKRKTILLASAPDLAGIYAMIYRYWYANPGEVDLQTVDNKTWDIYRSGQRIDDFRVVLKGKRFRFEGIL